MLQTSSIRAAPICVSRARTAMQKNVHGFPLFAMPFLIKIHLKAVI
jgi:hypothetical protein